jgi:chemotaxis protein MotB
MTDERKGPAPKEREVDRDEGGHSWRPPAPTPPKARTSWMAVVVSVLALGAAAAAGVYAAKTHMDLGAVSADAQAKQRELAEERGKNAELARELEAHRAGRAASDKQVSEMKASAQATRAEIDDLRRQRAEIEQRLAAWKAITTKLQKMIDAGRLKVMIRDGRMVLKLSNEILFESGKAALANDGKAALREVAAILRQFPERRFMIAGHTDNIPLHNESYRNNWELSTARAVTVTEFLVGAGLRPDHLVAAGYGEFDPVANNRTEAGRRDNRRIELVLLPNIAELPPLPSDPAAPSAPPQGR